MDSLTGLTGGYIEFSEPSLYSIHSLTIPYCGFIQKLIPFTVSAAAIAFNPLFWKYVPLAAFILQLSLSHN